MFAFKELKLIDQEFEKRNQDMIGKMGEDSELADISSKWFNKASCFEYSYHFNWMGMPIIQFPQDVIAMQEIIWQVRPKVIVECGVARGGSIVFHASMLELLGEGGKVVGVDIEIKEHNRKAIESHPMSKNISLIEGSSVDKNIADRVYETVGEDAPVMVVLDSLHTHDHVLREMELYSPLVKNGSYMLVFDTIIEFMPEDFFPNRPWSHGDNPWSAVQEFMKTNDRFQIDQDVQKKLQITVAPDGYLKCVKD